MNLSLAEAARLMGKTTRQVRYLIAKEKIPAQKVGGRWFIDRESLPISKGAERARERKVAKAVHISRDVLRVPGPPRKHYTVLDLKAFTAGRACYHGLKEEAGEARVQLRESLLLICCGCHAFQTTEKRAYFVRARESACRALGLLLLAGAIEPPMDCLEKEYIPALGGLIRRLEGRQRA
ncbi:MAG: helix-turn-helix domain-containing protein [Acidobacteriota bacterium]|nr:helix-turn-helix domain-containing protein [Acidobacteriota bacterium]